MLEEKLIYLQLRYNETAQESGSEYAGEEGGGGSREGTGNEGR